MKITVEVYEDGKAAVRTDTNGFLPCNDEAEARAMATGVKLGFNAAIYEARRTGKTLDDMGPAVIE